MNDEFQDRDGNPVSLDKLCREEPEWAANRIRVERAAAQELVDAMPKCLIHSSTFAERYGWMADNGDVVYHCSDCQIDGSVVPWDGPLRKLLALLGNK